MQHVEDFHHIWSTDNVAEIIRAWGGAPTGSWGAGAPPQRQFTTSNIRSTDNAADIIGVWGGAPAGGWGGRAPPQRQIAANFARILRVLFTSKMRMHQYLYTYTNMTDSQPQLTFLALTSNIYLLLCTLRTLRVSLLKFDQLLNAVHNNTIKNNGTHKQ